MLKFSVLCLVAFAVGTLAIDDERIVGGQQATRGQFPYQVMLRRISQRTHYCSGAIISDRFILTTATCAQGRAALPTNVRIAVGAHHRLNDGTLLTVSRITNHPQFNRRTMRNNICIIQTTDKIMFTPLIQPAKLPAAAFLDKTGTVLTVSGWGQNHTGSPTTDPSDYPDFLQFLRTKSFKRRDCARSLGGLGRFVLETTICTRNEQYEGTCLGDNGGPLTTVDNTLVGLHSWGSSICGSGKPDIFTGVFPHIQFIRENMARP